MPIVCWGGGNGKVTLIDINETAVQSLRKGRVPFKEDGAEAILAECLDKNLFITSDKNVVAQADVICFVTGTPIDEHLNPRIKEVVDTVREYATYFTKKQLIVLRSTLYPGTTKLIENIILNESKAFKLAFCPERIQQGKGISEIFSLPQLVSGTTKKAEKEASELFSIIADKTILLSTEEAELAKLLTNSWRYLEFAVANQFYMMVTELGFDFQKIFTAMTEDYPRAQHFASPGLAAGPCLFKDTMQLAAFHKNHFFLGHSAMLINEGMPAFLVEEMKNKLDSSLKGKKVAILGMTFKANNDDIRESLSFKIKKLLEFQMAEVIMSDPYLPDSYELEEALELADGIILGVPHKEYFNLNINKAYVDCWGIWA